VDLLFGDALMIAPGGELLAYRKAVRALAVYCGRSPLQSFLRDFFRRRVLERGIYFDPDYRMAGDGDFVVRALRAGRARGRAPALSGGVHPDRDNLGGGDHARREGERFSSSGARVDQRPAPAAGPGASAERWLAGGCRQPFPLTYAVYIGSPETRASNFHRATRRIPMARAFGGNKRPDENRVVHPL
jgi:hypothetical protein